MQTYKVFLIVFISLIFSGCGGDSDEESAATPTNLNSSNLVEDSTKDQTSPEEKDNRVAVTAQNSTQLARITYHRFIELGTLGDFGSGSIVTGAVIKPTQPFNFILFAKQQIEWANRLEIQTTLSQLVVGAMAEDTLDCTQGGTVHFLLNDKDQDEDFSKGDTMRLTFQNCKESTETLNGPMIMTVIEVEKDQSTQEANLVELNFDLTDLTAVDLEGSQTYQGNFNLRLEGSTAENFLSLLLTTDSFTVITADSTETLSKFSLKLSTDLNALISTLDTKGIMTNSQLGGFLSFKTIEPFKQLEQDTYPYSGSLKITGHHDSSVTLIALDAVTARLDIDENGDGASDQVTDIPWETLFSS